MKLNILDALRSRKTVIDMGFEMLKNSLVKSHGTPDQMSPTDMKAAILGLQTICTHQQALIETLYTALTQEPENPMPGFLKKFLNKD